MSLNKFGIAYCILVFFILGSFQYSDVSKRKDAVRNEIDRRLSEFRKEKELECQMKAIERAEAIVDSILHRDHNVPKIDSIEIPSRPNRPEKAGQIVIDTTEKVKPLFDTVQ